ncbi:MAG: hypothetical protein HFF17_01675 [Oscillospiraceae bacterium]|nr:hypothetical protein [Oscillospiraceae bacterium]
MRCIPPHQAKKERLGLVLINGNVPGGEGFFRLANNFSAGILTDFKGMSFGHVDIF